MKMLVTIDSSGTISYSSLGQPGISVTQQAAYTKLSNKSHMIVYKQTLVATTFRFCI